MGNCLARAAFAAMPVKFHWATPPAAYVPQPQHWTYAVAAPYSADRTRLTDIGWETGLYAESPADAASLAEGLDESWGITDRVSLLAQLHSLLTDGHRSEYNAWREHWHGSLTAEADLREEGDEDNLQRYLWFKDDAFGSRTINFLAWDLVRFAFLAISGATLGYITMEERDDALRHLVAPLRRAYGTWHDVGAAWLAGRRWWSASIGDPHDKRQAAILEVAEGPEGPWGHLPWTLPVPAPQGVFVRALLEEGIAEPLSPHDVDSATQEALELDHYIKGFSEKQ
ncbi:putative protein YbeU [Vanrija pseudolonga]|uniref:Purtative protein YbeU n=1 Tax=Vanrija pseudolonga TaxID=143232 RepID=A0AAF0YH99_9TREE|nr:purtative protein YbeU [Vanrija pseudolonga]